MFNIKSELSNVNLKPFKKILYTSHVSYTESVKFHIGFILKSCHINNRSHSTQHINVNFQLATQVFSNSYIDSEHNSFNKLVDLIFKYHHSVKF